MAEPKERLLWIDALRGAAILMVVLAHSIAAVMMFTAPGEGRIAFQGGWIHAADVNNLAYNLIASVYMPLFAFVSGLVQGRRGLRVSWRTVWRRAGGLMVPYVAWLVVGGLLGLKPVLADPASWLRSLGPAFVDPRNSGLWFLYALFMIYVLMAAVTSISDSPRALVVTSVGLVVLLFLPVPNTLGLRDVAWLFPFFAMGMLEARTGALKKRRTLIASAIAYPLLLAVMWPTILEIERWWIPSAREFLLWLPLVPQFVTDWTPPLIVHFGRYACAAAGIAVLYNLYQHLPRRAVAIQAPIGQRSLGIYATHQRFIAALAGTGLSSAVAIFGIATVGGLTVTLILERIPVISNLLLGQPAKRFRRPDDTESTTAASAASDE